MNKHQKEYIHRINRVLDYIESHIDQELSLETLAEIANFSPFHFHRIFSAFTGETINGFVRRIRLEKAGSMLITYEEKTVSEIAYACGFQSASVFCRSFKSRFKMSAQEFRESWEPINSKNGQSDRKNGKILTENQTYVCDVELLKMSQMKSKIEIKEMPAMDLIYCRHVGEYHLIANAYEKLRKWAEPRGLFKPDTKAVTVYHDDPKVTEQDNIRQSASILLDHPVKAEGEFGNLSVPGGKYVVGSFTISATEFKEAWDAVCIWLSESGYEPTDACPYELYHESEPPEKFVVDICIPVKPM
ncbi:AraC family transcriptional regulator [Marinifilum breve]|uniref:AraC family transcriptional regulator n=1 Tax=Marinifilum breve TaxID=2184082 RepID=A0A2V4AA43_9BACT|nr:AraC family transcriptional regulator [Marinifilum breve]PXY00844.1 AraC family transcriptional regulator [Marinifilum breve]